MPTIDIDEFDETPHVGDKVKVTGKVKSIDEDTGEVDVSYDDVSIVDKKRKKRRDNDDDDDVDEVVMYQGETAPPDSQSLDTALSQAFPRSE